MRDSIPVAFLGTVLAAFALLWARDAVKRMRRTPERERLAQIEHLRRELVRCFACGGGLQGHELRYLASMVPDDDEHAASKIGNFLAVLERRDFAFAARLHEFNPMTDGVTARLLRCPIRDEIVLLVDADPSDLISRDEILERTVLPKSDGEAAWSAANPPEPPLIFS